MVSSRFIFLVTVLIISEAIADECKVGNKEFCDLIGDAHKANEDGIKLMNGALNGNATKGLKLADKRVVEVLKGEKEQLITAVKKALQAELSAFVQVKADCYTLGHNYDETCEKVTFEIAYATLGLIMAIAEVHPDTATKTKVENIISDLIPYMFIEPASLYRNALHASGKKILTII
ncbi:unnamed protein product [Nippostrongylus brasiliensis]|uniref:Pectinesterase inhibitor domain-containing protein n=1 Tax=Nippostrongylus brasiliensis TaxID=27835 RepID=A0A0N4YD98_NIPBR|nr:unnamed protein product [Nippostrongylus brasiliensis]